MVYLCEELYSGAAHQYSNSKGSLEDEELRRILLPAKPMAQLLFKPLGKVWGPIDKQGIRYGWVEPSS